MQRRPLGQSKIEVTPIILGTWAMGGWMWGGTNEQECVAAVQAGIDNGITTIDTAPVYGTGLSEEIVGRAIQGRRHQVVIATKCGMNWTSKEGVEPAHSVDQKGSPIIIRKNCKPIDIAQECEESLKRLKIDEIDLYQIHWPDTSTPIEDSWGAMVKLKEQGKVKAIGVSNYNLDQLQRAHAIHPVASIQPPFSLIRRGIEQDILPFCQKNCIGVIVYSPLERGLLTGKIHSQHPFLPGDHRATKEIFSGKNLLRINKALEQIRPIAERHCATIAQVIVNCVIHRPGITSALVGARNPTQAMENARAAFVQLDPEEVKLISDTLADKKLQRPLYD